jgi:hypothetical protein
LFQKHLEGFETKVLTYISNREYFTSTQLSMPDIESSSSTRIAYARPTQRQLLVSALNYGTLNVNLGHEEIQLLDCGLIGRILFPGEQKSYAIYSNPKIAENLMRRHIVGIIFYDIIDIGLEEIDFVVRRSMENISSHTNMLLEPSTDFQPQIIQPNQFELIKTRKSPRLSREFGNGVVYKFETLRQKKVYRPRSSN